MKRGLRENRGNDACAKQSQFDGPRLPVSPYSPCLRGEDSCETKPIGERERSPYQEPSCETKPIYRLGPPGGAGKPNWHWRPDVE